MDAMYTDSYEVDHLTSCGCDDSGVTFDPSGELAPPLPPVDFDVQPDASFDVMAPGQPGSTDVSYDVAPEFTPDVTTIPTPDTLPPAPSCGPETEVAPDLTTIPVPDAPPAPFGSVEGEGSFDVTGLGQPGTTDVAPDTSIDVIGLGQPGNTDVAPDTSIDVIGLGQPGNTDVAVDTSGWLDSMDQPAATDAPAPEFGVSVIGGQSLFEPVVITDAAPSVDPGLTTSVIGGESIDTTVAGDPAWTTSVIGDTPLSPMYQLLAMAHDPLQQAQILGMINSQNHMTDVWLSDFTASII